MRFDPGEKQQFKNQTGGFIGVTVYTPAGDEKGISVEPGGVVRMSEAERELTAAAPRNPKDNPFVEQDVEFFDPESGEKTTRRIIPLVAWDEDRPTGVADSREENAAKPARRTGAKTGGKPTGKPRASRAASKPAA